MYHYRTTKTLEKRKASSIKKKLGGLVNINTDYFSTNDKGELDSLKADTEYEFTIDAYHKVAKDYIDSKIPNLKWINKSSE